MLPIPSNLSQEEGAEKKSAKDALLLWCQRKTRGYPNVDVRDFSGSWRSGMAFNALIHAHCPNLVAYEKLEPKNHKENLNTAFETADKKLDIPKLLDAEGRSKDLYIHL